MEDVIHEFSTLLKSRLGKVYTTEDSVRYTFFAALLKHTPLEPHNIILEYPHPKLLGAEVDTYIPTSKEREGLVLEFKYDRQMPSGKNSPRPHKAGKLFNDLYRLTLFDTDRNARALFIYLTDEEMANYFRNPNNGLADFFDLPVGKVLQIDKDYITSKSETFQKALGGPLEISIECICSEKLPGNHQLRIYELVS